MIRLPRLGPSPSSGFPPLDTALDEPDGLLAFGGDLHPQRLLDAYAHGIFPWYSEGQPILWWSPDPRLVIPTGALHLSRRTRRRLRASAWQVVADTAFDAVIDACAAVRDRSGGTWITADMREAYRQLHRLGHAHSIEVLGADGALAGGLYGVAIGRMFFGESMFSAATDGSKAALAALCLRMHEWGWPLLDAQVESGHLQRMGGVAMPRAQFVDELGHLCALPGAPGCWTQRFGTVAVDTL